MNSLLCQLYEQYQRDEDCPTFVRNVSQKYAVGTIEKLAASKEANTRKAAVLALGFLGDVHNTPTLGKLIQDPCSVIRSMAEQAIQQAWFRVGTEKEQKELLHIERLNMANEYERVVALSTELIESNPDIAEAWNQRAIAYFNLMQFTASIKDCYQTLERNRFHYPAAIGMGHCYLEINDTYNAIESFKRALILNPGLTFLRAHINYLRKSLDNHHG